MERLTVKRDDGRWALANNDRARPMEQMEKIPLAIDCLAAYEDTGLEPKEVQLISNVLREVGETYNCWFDYVVNCTVKNSHLKELAQAEKDGRLVVLPCKVVYIPTWDAGEKCDLACPVTIDGEGCCDLCDKSQQFIYEKQCRQEHIDQIGKTIFLTREEAEAALKKREADNETD